MSNEKEKMAKPREAEEELLLPLTARQLAELEKQRQEGIARDAERARRFRDRVRGLEAPLEIAGD